MSGLSSILQKWEAIIGLEVHAQLSTRTKMFCSCRNVYGDPPNTHTCPVCLGLPGSLPVPNGRAIEFALRLGLALGCDITPYSRFARKNYFYPDLPKGYQISQYDEPLCRGGSVRIKFDDDTKEIPLIRIHLEEDAGKSIHSRPDDGTAVDFNRCGVPLVEIVTQPVIRSPQEARTYLSTLKQILEYLDICDCNMEEGNLRCDANISVRPRGKTEMGTRTEMKNLNSFRSVERGLAFEIGRHVEVLEKGGEVEHVTLLWNEELRIAEVMRAKEEAHDYRYFPDPDLVPVTVSEERLSDIRADLPELPYVREERLVTDYALRPEDVLILTSDSRFADYFEQAVKLGANPEEASKWMVGEVNRILKDKSWEVDAFPIGPDRFVALLDAVRDGTVSVTMAKSVLKKMLTTDRFPQEIIQAEDLGQVSDKEQLKEVINEVVGNSPDEVTRYQEGNKNLLGYFMGEVMKQTKGKSDPQVVRTLLKEFLNYDN